VSGWSGHVLVKKERKRERERERERVKEQGGERKRGGVER
jgi:hypothetical protein